MLTDLGFSLAITAPIFSMLGFGILFKRIGWISDEFFGLQEVVAEARAIRVRLDAVRDAPLPPDHELPVLTARQEQRLEAFALRKDR